jgi:Holliday junction resolvase RusA-like endonuclease
MIAFWHGRAVSENRRLAPAAGQFAGNVDYKAFKESVAWAVRPHAERFQKPVSVRLLMILNPRMDAQNVIKPVLDALQLAEVIADDRQVRHLSFYREDAKAKEDDSIGIFVRELGS